MYSFNAAQPGFSLFTSPSSSTVFLYHGMVHIPSYCFHFSQFHLNLNTPYPVNVSPNHPLALLSLQSKNSQLQFSTITFQFTRSL